MEKAELTPNQVVASNLAKLRHQKGWSAENTAKELGRLLRRQISLASYSAMERSVDTSRRKRFDADEICAISFLFDVPTWTLFVPKQGQRLRLPGLSAQALADAPRAAVSRRRPGCHRRTRG